MQTRTLRALLVLSSCVIGFAFLIATDRPAHAYVDPGAGLLMLQSAGAAVVGMTYILRRKITSLFAKTPDTAPPISKARTEP